MKIINKKTLEEVAHQFAEEHREVYQKSNYASMYFAFYWGANWQKEQMNSDEDMMFAYEQGARLALISQSPLALHKGEFPTPKEWLNQVKK